MELVQCYVAAQIGGELVENGYMHMYGCPFCCSLETITTLLITYVYVLVVSNSVIPWNIAYQAPLSMEVSRQEYWSGLPFTSPGVFLTQGSNSGPPALQAPSLLSETPGKPMDNVLGILS